MFTNIAEIVMKVIRIIPLGQQCVPYSTAPAATTLECSETLCNATCMAKYKFPKGESSLTVECMNGKWTIKGANYKNVQELPGCQR